MRLALVVTAGVSTLAALSACGGSGGSLGEPAPCATPTPASTPAVSANQQFGRYTQTVTRAADSLTQRLATFRAAYPEGKFYRSDGFRPDFVAYYGATLCALDVIDTVAPPSTAAAAERDAQIKAVVVDYRATMAYGLEAVRKRNTSDYRKWNRRVDEAAARMATALALPTR